MLHVTKATGEVEPYSEEKLIASVRRAGIPSDIEEKVLRHVKEKLYDDIPTSVIYHHIKEFLKRSEKPYMSAKYSLKQAIMDLGPTGYPFEDYIAHVMQSQGYITSVRNLLRGACISHEIDVVATKHEEKIMVEAKFHNFSGTKTNVHVSMYTKARFDDVKDRYQFSKAWLVTNTKMTSDAIVYATCNHMRITSWEYPQSDSLRHIVERENLIPITALTSLSHTQKAQLLEKGIVLTKSVIGASDVMESLSFQKHKIENVITEARQLTEG